MKVLISGAGIAGPTLAYWLARYVNEPTSIEKAPNLRTLEITKCRRMMFHPSQHPHHVEVPQAAQEFFTCSM